MVKLKDIRFSFSTLTEKSSVQNKVKKKAYKNKPWNNLKPFLKLSVALKIPFSETKEVKLR